MIKIKIGEQKAINYSLKVKSTGLPINLVNSTILFQLREDIEETNNFIIEKSVTEVSDINDVGQIFDATNGKFSIFFKSEDTLCLDLNKEYYYTLWRIFGETKEVISSSGENIQVFNVCPA